MAWGKAGSTTLGSAGDNVSVTCTASINNQILFHKINDTSSGVNPNLTFNSDSGSNYTQRNCTNGGSESTLVNQAKLEFTNAGVTPTSFVVGYTINISGEEKLSMLFDVEENTAGVGTAPNRIEHTSKWVNTSSQITTVNMGNDDSGDYAIGSNLTVLGSDITPAGAIPAIDNVQENSLFIEPSTARRYWFSEASESLASSQTSSNDGFGVQLNPSSEDSKLGAKLHSSNGAVGKSISKVIFQLRNSSSSSSSYGIPCKIYNASDTLVATSTNTPNFTDLVQGAWATPYTNYNIEYTFSPAVSVAADYRIVVEPQGGTQDVDGTNMRVTSSSSDSSLFLVSFRGGAWRADSTYSSWDPVIYLYESVPATWTMEPTFEDDFSSDNWADKNTDTSISGGVLNFHMENPDGADRGSSRTISPVSDSAMIMRAHIEVTARTAGSGYGETFFGISNSDAPQTGAQDWVGANLFGSNNVMYINDVQNATIPSYSGTSEAETWAVQDYYYELIFTSSTTYTIQLFSDSDYSTPLTSALAGTKVNHGGTLDTIKIVNLDSNSGTGSTTGKIHYVKIYNGVTTIN